MNRAVLLFDVDGTLLLTGGAGRRALGRAFDEELARPDALAAVDLRGMTDPAILRAALEACGVAWAPELVARLVGRYLAHLEAEVASATGYLVLPGVEAVIDAAREAPGVALGLGTGNIERGARLKLARSGLDTRFAFGGFGDDGEARADVLRAGAERGARHLGAPLARCRVVVIGDTPRDVEAARAIGAEAVAVATGGYDGDALRAAGADSVFPSLAAPGALAAILGPPD